MLLLLKRAAMSVVLASICPAQDEMGMRWKDFSSNIGFSVMYPASWFRIGLASEGRLDVLSSKGGAEAIVIKRGQAEIMVFELQGSPTASLSQLMDEDARGAVSIVSRADIHNKGAGENSCNDLKEVVSKHGAVPAEDVKVHVPYIVDTDFYCEVNGRKFTTRLRSWENDKRTEEYQGIALQVAKSLHLTQ